MRFRRKPVLVHAFRWQDQPDMPAWLADALSHDHCYRYAPVGRTPQLMVRTPKGAVAAHKGDWLIRQRDGSLSIAPHDEFAADYDVATNVVDWEDLAKTAAGRVKTLETSLAAALNEIDKLRDRIEQLGSDA